MGTTTVAPPGSPSRRGMQALDWLLLTGVVIAPMTASRVGKVGPAESLTLLWCLFALVKRPWSPFRPVDVMFWIVFLASMLTGTLILLFTLPEPTSPDWAFGWAFVGLLTWLYFATVSLLALAGLQGRSVLSLESILTWVGTAATVVYGFLYLYAQTISDTFLGLPLWYAEVRFSGGATNPHQVSLLIAAAFGVHLRLLLFRPAVRRRSVSAILLAITVWTGLGTESSTLLVALTVGLAAAILIAVAKTRHDRLEQVLLGIVLTFAVVASWRLLAAESMAFVESDENGMGRFEIWKSFSKVLDSSPIFGLGPGPHALDGRADFHNSFIDIWSIAGLLGLVAFLVYMGYLIRGQILHDSTLLVVTLPLLAYGVAGFSARRLVFWAVLMIVVALSRQGRQLGPEDVAEGPGGRPAERNGPVRTRAGEATAPAAAAYASRSARRRVAGPLAGPG